MRKGNDFSQFCKKGCLRFLLSHFTPSSALHRKTNVRNRLLLSNSALSAALQRNDDGMSVIPDELFFPSVIPDEPKRDQESHCLGLIYEERRFLLSLFALSPALRRNDVKNGFYNPVETDFKPRSRIKELRISKFR